jgi:hypothetical protein
MYILRTSSSRPDILKQSTLSIFNHLKTSQVINQIIHEDVINQEKSLECYEFLKNLPNCECKIDNPALGHSASFYWLSDQLPNDIKYFMFWEDDYDLDRDVDLDALTALMDKYQGINQISFPKRDILTDKAGWMKKPVMFDNFKLTVSNHWYVSPGIWRYSFIMPFIEKMKKDNPVISDGTLGFGWHWGINKAMKGKNLTNQKVEEIEKKYGHYYLGWPENYSKLITHTGTPDKSIRNGYKP